jgi:MFS family permease
MDNPIFDFSVLRHTAYRITVLGGFPIRVMVGAGPFLLPLMFQIGFGMSPIASGVLTIASAAGALSTRGLMMRTIRVIGFRKVLITAAAASGAFYIVYGLFTPQLPRALMFAVMAVGGLFTSATLVALSTLGFTEIPRERTGHATALATMAQQLATAVGVVLGASLLSFFSFVHGNPVGHLQAADFAPTFAAVALLGFASANAFRKFSPQEGDELRGAA